ncbi:hypothetical protein CH372_20255 [Leptospira meyeri]|uniref:hypothetical protein n=1 Tax=Leptospira meyeri TaxID=29508 RepID=UPI000C29F283|nr:hypothetical protein [Leptospira meyeri]PKA10279.1 hypothetical protein CH372_20255 [Leptospira meyeri]PKA23028.1 hypothetical protein CH381_27870 [Leptospira sp. mixed culture ATI2-C-A1]
MSELKKFHGLSKVNTAEAIFGDFLFAHDKLIIPYYNINIIHDQNHDLAPFNGKYIKFCFLIFEGISGIVWNYELSKFLPEKNRECYGGDYYLNNVYKEFWLSYNHGYLILEKTFFSSTKPWNSNQISTSSFQISKETLNNLMKLL